MTLVSIDAGVTANLSAALADFEAGFTYPLGPHRRFRIVHGVDYSSFYRSQGEARVVALTAGDRVTGVIAAACRTLVLGDGSRCTALYLGDLKLSIEVRGGRALLGLIREIQAWAAPRTSRGWCVVMDGTTSDPGRYTGRCGIPAFRPVAKLAILRLDCQAGAIDPAWNASSQEAAACFAELSAGTIYADGADRTLRSHMAPCWLRDPLGRSCGLLEDTLRAKRLYDDAGGELLSAHLGRFAWRDAAAAVACLLQARRRAAALGRASLFCAIPAERTAELIALGLGSGLTVAGATICASGLPDAQPWTIDTADI